MESPKGIMRITSAACMGREKTEMSRTKKKIHNDRFFKMAENPVIKIIFPISHSQPYTSGILILKNLKKQENYQVVL
jgi:hypothetical protein